MFTSRSHGPGPPADVYVYGGDISRMNRSQSRVLDELFVLRAVVELESGEQCEDLLLRAVYVV